MDDAVLHDMDGWVRADSIIYTADFAYPGLQSAMRDEAPFMNHDY